MARSTDRRSFLGWSVLGAAAAGAGAGAGPGTAGAAGTATAALVDVRDHGAAGDGVTDDTAAIQAAIDTLRDPARPGGCVLFPPGVYLVSSSLVVDYGITLRGVNPAASTIRMSPAVLADLVVGGPSFPVYVQLVDLTLDGGLDDRHRDRVPPGSGAVVVEEVRAGVGTEVTVSGGDVRLAHGDVLRRAGLPSMVITAAVDVEAGDTGSTYVADWTGPPGIPVRGTWHVFKAGSLIRGIGRSSVRRCMLLAAKRHGIELDRSTQGHIGECEIGWSQGAGVFAWESSDLTISRTWSFRNGGPDLHLFAAVDVRVSDCILEASGSASISADWSEVDVRSCGLWGARGALVHATNAGGVRLADLKLRDPGYGGPDDDSYAAPGFPAGPARSAMQLHFASTEHGAHVRDCILHHAVAPAAPLLTLSGGGRSSLSGLDWAGSVRFADRGPGHILVDGGTDTIVRGCRGLPDQPWAW